MVVFKFITADQLSENFIALVICSHTRVQEYSENMGILRIITLHVHVYMVCGLLVAQLLVVACAMYKSARSRVRSLAVLNMLRRCAPRQGTLLTHALSQSRSKWVPGRTVKACVFE